MEIKSISQKIFKTSSAKIENSKHTNPFGVNFKGNIISADVFESSEKADNVSFKGAEWAAKASGKCRMVASAIVGSIGDVTSAIKTRLNSVVDFGRRIKEGTTNLIDRIPSMMGTESMLNRINDYRVYNVSRLLKQQPESLENSFRELNLAMEAV